MAQTATEQPVDLRGFELRADSQDIIGATLSYDDGRTFDLKATLDSSNDYGPAGVVVVDALAQPGLASALETSPILKAATIPDAAKKKLQAAADARGVFQEQDAAQLVGVDSIRAQQKHVEEQQASGSEEDQSNQRSGASK